MGDLSFACFDIAKKRSWDAVTNTYTDYPIRASDIYVFCLFTEKDPGRADLLDVTQWEFYVVLAYRIEQELGDQKSVSLSRIQSMCKPVEYHALKDWIDSEIYNCAGTVVRCDQISSCTQYPNQRALDYNPCNFGCT